jgi:RNA polymerase sigma-70 factor (ECF subfamily)
MNSWDDAMEVVNSGFLKIFLKIEHFNGKGSFEGWMKRTMVNTALDQLKSRKPFSDSVEELNSYEADYYAENTALETMGQEELIEVIQSIPPTSRAVFNMYVFEGFKHKEICKELGISEGTSHWHLQNARKLLKEKLEQIDIHN